MNKNDLKEDLEARKKRENAKKVKAQKERDFDSVVFEDPKMFLTNENDQQGVAKGGRQAAFLSVITDPKACSKSPIAAVHIMAFNKPDPKNSQPVTLLIGLILKEKTDMNCTDLVPLNKALRANSLPPIKKFSSSAARAHEDFIMSSVHFPNTGYQPRAMYDLPKRLKLNNLQALGLIDDKTASICRVFAYQAKNRGFLEKYKHEQGAVFEKMMDGSSLSHADRHHERLQRNMNRARGR